MNMADVRGPDERRSGISPRLIVAAALGVLALIFVFQNTESRKVHFLWATIDLPTWLWMLVLLAVGVVIGSIFPWFRRKRRD